MMTDARRTPPTAGRVMARAMVLATVACRGSIEQDAGSDEAEALREDLPAWLEHAGALREAEPGELALLNSPLGAVAPQAAIDASWRGEGLAVLAWALGRFELPPHDTLVDPKEAADSVGFFEEDAAELIAAARLRPAEELKRFAQRTFALHWRLREFSLRPAAMDFARAAYDAWFGPMTVDGLPLADGDLAVGGLPLAKAEPGDVLTWLSIAQERHQAANWLIGQGAVYSKVDTPT